MYTKHFFKMLLGFTLVIGLGIIGLFLINSYHQEQLGRSDIEIGTVSGGGTAACTSTPASGDC